MYLKKYIAVFETIDFRKKWQHFEKKNFFLLEKS